MISGSWHVVAGDSLALEAGMALWEQDYYDAESDVSVLLTRCHARGMLQIVCIR